MLVVKPRQMELPIALGQVVAQKYRVDRFIGRGGMGVVVAGFHLELDQPVAIKFLLAEWGLESEGAERFRREARIAAKIHSEHVARVFDVGLLDERVPFMVMELLHGSDLERVLEQRGSLPVAEAVGFLLQAIDAVAEAHSLGIVHRDLKPTNLFLAQHADGSCLVKVLDFGISKSLGADRPGAVLLTRTAAFVGSPLYMSPEQMRSARDVDARTDVWALGALLYTMVTGQLPHPGASLPEVCLAVMNARPRSLAELMPNAPEGFEPIVMKCLAKEPEQRYRSVAELACALLPFAPESRRVVERTLRLLGGGANAAVTPPLLRGSQPPLGFGTFAQRLLAPDTNEATPPPTAGDAPSARASRRTQRTQRGALLASLLGTLTALGALGYGIRHKPGPTAAATLSPTAAVSAAQPRVASLVDEAHAAPPAPPVLPEARAALPAPPVLPEEHAALPAPPVVVVASSTPRVAPRAPIVVEPYNRGAGRVPDKMPPEPDLPDFGGRR